MDPRLHGDDNNEPIFNATTLLRNPEIIFCCIMIDMIIQAILLGLFGVVVALVGLLIGGFGSIILGLLRAGIEEEV